MTVAFCGHAAFLLKEEYERRILLCLERLVGDQKAELFLGDTDNLTILHINAVQGIGQLIPTFHLYGLSRI